MKNSRFPLSGSVTLALGITTGFVLLISILLIFTTGWKASDAMLLVSLLCTSISLFLLATDQKRKSTCQTPKV